MRTIRFSDRRVVSTLASMGLLLGMIMPAVIPSFASAAEVTTRSIDMSSSAASATGVTYDVTFTPVSNAAGYIIDFCSDTSLVGQTCGTPTGLSTASASTSGSATVTPLSSDTAAKVVVSLTGGSANTVAITGMVNPSTIGTFYARIVTYATSGDMTGVDAPTDNTTLTTGNTDSGGIALSTTSAFQVNASVLESMVFCVAGSDTSVVANTSCADSAITSIAPNLQLGVSTGGAVALESGTLSTGTVYTQLSTNAAHGAVVSLKSSATSCGGLELSGSGACNIAPSPIGGFSAGTADFGVKTGTAVATSNGSGGTYASATGTYEPASGSSYGSSNYFMNYVGGNGTGVTSPYGDPILDSAGAPINNENMPLTFGASISPNTPAGNYSATLNLIASGTF
jgi:hypothetical protein